MLGVGNYNNNIIVAMINATNSPCHSSKQGIVYNTGTTKNQKLIEAPLIEVSFASRSTRGHLLLDNSKRHLHYKNTQESDGTSLP